jgi:hypothetical protein
MTAATDPGRTAYEARFADHGPRDFDPWDSLTPEVKAIWARVETAAWAAGAKAMREAAKIACLDLNDTYREASEAHLQANNITKAREAMDWAIGALECAHAVAKLDAGTKEQGGGSAA